MEAKKTAGRPLMMPLDWMFDKKNKCKYQNVKKLAHGRDACRRWSPGPV